MKIHASGEDYFLDVFLGGSQGVGDGQWMDKILIPKMNELCATE